MKFRLLQFIIAFTLLLIPLKNVQAVSPSDRSRIEAFTTSFTLSDLGMKDIYIKSIYDQESIRFSIPQNWKIDRSTLRLHISHDKKLLPQFSELTIALNDEPVANIILSPENAEETQLEITFPENAFRPGENKIIFRFSLRLNDKGCGDQGDQDLWAKIFSDTVIILEGHEVPATIDLEKYPQPFSTLSASYNSPQLSFVLPSNPTATELSAATQIAASLGQSTDWKTPPLNALTADRLDMRRAASENLIIIDTNGRNPLDTGTGNGLNGGVSTFNPFRTTLVVSGKDDASLLQSAAMLSVQSIRKNLRGSSSDPIPSTPLPISEKNSRSTFSELGFLTERVGGIGEHDLFYPIDIPYDWKTTSEASILIWFSHARSLASESVMKTFINGFQTAEVVLDTSNDKVGRLEIKLSPRQIHPGRNWLHLSFKLGVRGANCNYRYLEKAWVEISSEQSVVNLAHVISIPPLELRYLPSPLLTPPDLSSVLFVLPSKPSQADLTAMVRLSAILGTHSSTDGLFPRAITADHFDPVNFPNNQVIAIGTFGSNEILTRYDNDLPQPLKLESGLVSAGTGRELLLEEQAGQAGYLQILEAPWSSNSTLTVISAPNDELLLRVVNAVPSLGKRLNAQGNVLVVSPKKMVGLSLGGLARIPLSNSLRITLAVVLFFAFAAFGIIGLVIRRRRQTREKDTKHAEE